MLHACWCSRRVGTTRPTDVGVFSEVGRVCPSTPGREHLLAGCLYRAARLLVLGRVWKMSPTGVGISVEPRHQSVNPLSVLKKGGSVFRAAPQPSPMKQTDKQRGDNGRIRDRRQFGE